MKKISAILTGLLITFGAHAELTPDEQKVADMLLSEDLNQLKVAAQTVSRQEMSNIELIDIMAEVLLRKYEGAYPNEIDTLAWMARAIGTTENGRYHAALSEVVNNSDNRKLRRHADSALDDLDDPEGVQYVSGMYQLPEGLYAKESDAERDARIKQLLLAGDLASLKEGVQAIVGANIQNTELTDIAAEILISNHSNANDNQIDTFAWTARALGQSTSGRYYHVLLEVEENGAHRKLRNYAEDALDDHGEAQGEQYKQGMLGMEVGTYSF